jgi:hypothetical protein
MKKIKIKITEDRGTEMLRIETETKCLFEGNYWDFDRCGSAFKELLESVGADVKLEEKDYNTWYK